MICTLIARLPGNNQPVCPGEGKGIPMLDAGGGKQEDKAAMPATERAADPTERLLAEFDKPLVATDAKNAFDNAVKSLNSVMASMDPVKFTEMLKGPGGLLARDDKNRAAKGGSEDKPDPSGKFGGVDIVGIETKKDANGNDVVSKLILNYPHGPKGSNSRIALERGKAPDYSQYASEFCRQNNESGMLPLLERIDVFDLAGCGEEKNQALARNAIKSGKPVELQKPPAELGSMLVATNTDWIKSVKKLTQT